MMNGDLHSLPTEEKYALVEEAGKTFGEAAASALARKFGIAWPILLEPCKYALIRLRSDFITGGDTPEHVGR